MEYIIHKLSLNMHSSISQTSLYVKSGDTKRKLRITLTENGKVYRISDGCVAVFSAKKDNGDTLYNNCTIEDNTIVYEFTALTANVAGKMDCEIKLYDANNELITSPQFAIIVDDVVRNDEGVVASDEFSALTKLISDAIAVNNELNIKLAGGKLDFANAIKGHASGEVVSVNDISSAIHAVKIKVIGKNRITYPYHSSSITTNGITFSENGDGTVTVSGTASGKAVFYFQSYNSTVRLVKGESYVLSGCPSGGSSSTYSIQGTDGKTYPTDVGQGKVFTASDNGYYFYITVYAGTTVNNLMFKPQLEKGTTATDYVPYTDPRVVTVTEATTGATYTPNADGTCDVMSVYPTMTLMTDTNGVTIECEYNRDANVLVQELLRSAIGKISYIDLPASKWQGAESPYHQVVDVDGITEYSKVDLNPSVDQLEVFHDKDITFVTENDDGVVTVYCIGQKPTNDYTMQVTITEVIANG